MATGEEVPDAVGRPAAIGRDDRVSVEVVGRSVDEDERGPGPPIDHQVALVRGRRRDDQPVDAAGDELADERALTLWVLVDASRDDRHAARSGGILDRPGDGRRIGVGEILEDQPDGSGFAVTPTKAAGSQVGAVVELLDRALHPGKEIGGDCRLGIDDPRDGLQADTGQRRDVAHGRPRAIDRTTPVAFR